VAAAAVILALNVSFSKAISQVIGINLLTLDFIQSGSGPLRWIDAEFEMTTGITIDIIRPVY